MSGIHVGLRLVQTRPGNPTPRANVSSLLAALNPSTLASSECQNSEQRRARSLSLGVQRQPTSHPRVSPIVFNILGVASFSSGDSARICVTARFPAMRRLLSRRICSERHLSETAAARKRNVTAFEARNNCRTTSESFGLDPTNGPRPCEVPHTANTETETIASDVPR